MVTVSGHEIALGRRVGRDTLLAVGLGTVGLAVATVAVGAFYDPRAGGRFLAGAGAVLAGIWLAAAAVDQSDERGDSGSPDTARAGITLATWVTLVRGGLVAAVAGLVAAVGLDASGTIAWLPGVGVGLAAALDRVDGWLARSRDAETALGERLDIETDALLVLVAVTALVLEGLAPAPVLAVGLARYLYLLGQTLRPDGPSSTAEPRRWLNRLMYVAMVLTLWLAVLPITDAAVTRPLVTVVAVPFLLNFFRSWLAAGR